MKICLTALTITLSLHSLAQKDPATTYHAKDSVIAAITAQYETRSLLHRIVMGSNYRSTWAAPVKLPVFRLSSSSFTIDKLGGGEQTKSLRLRDRQGREWVLRTVNKTVARAIPGIFNNTPIEHMVQDMISASYPYSALIVAELAQATHIIAPNPRFYFVAPDTALGEYDSIFANTVCMLEEREPTREGSDTEDTEEVQEKIRKENENRVLQKKVLKARMLDMLVGDWDRHADQWRWDDIDSANTDYYYAIPRDRDNALFYSNGLLPLFARLSFMPYIGGFKKKSSGLRKLNRKSLAFDRQFLNELDASDWRQVITEFVNQVPDTVIDASVKTLPEPVYRMDGAAIAAKLKTRRDGLLRNGMKYYGFISRIIEINGTNENEIFVASGDKDRLIITVYRLEEGTQSRIYQRAFDHPETRYIHLNGLEGNDRFIVEADTRSRIKLKLFGGEGDDSYDVKGKVRTRIYDDKNDDNIIVNNNSARVILR